jgi:hypothetical protein
MKSSYLAHFIICFACIPLTLNAQQDLKLDPQSGLTFSFNQGDYTFQLGGFIQPSYRFQQQLSGEALSRTEPQNQQFFTAKRTFFQIGGTAEKEKVGFFIQTNFTDRQPLMDAYVFFNPLKNIEISVGQRQQIGNNREMLFREDRLQFTERSILSENFSKTGREFGIFVNYKIGRQWGLVPQLAITSGDGRNSFGTDSRDHDFGGLKYAARLDVYPFGFFSKGNENTSADLIHETAPKIVIGTAFSSNRGVTHSTGEGHGDFLLYNSNGGLALPHYQKGYVDIMAKYRGFSALIEFGNGFANGLKEQYINSNATQPMIPQQISQYLTLGQSLNTHLGYTTKTGYSLDLRYAQTRAEFQNRNSILQDMDAYTIGFSRYFAGNQLKLQSSYTWIQRAQSHDSRVFEIMMQFAF